MQKLIVTLMGKVNSNEADQTLGQVVFPRSMIKSGKLDGEQWFPLMPADVENMVSGDVRVQITTTIIENDQASVSLRGTTIILIYC